MILTLYTLMHAFLCLYVVLFVFRQLFMPINFETMTFNYARGGLVLS